VKILLAPAETKIDGGYGLPFCKENFYLDSLFDSKKIVFDKYQEFISKNDIEKLSSWFGLKNLDEVKKYSIPLENQPTIKAIQRYTGVVFKALNYDSLDKTGQKYCDENVMIFSNLFGVLNGGDLIPNYKYKQGAKLPNFDIERFYKQNLKNLLDEYLGDEVLDLRAKYYDKFYKPKALCIEFKFIKNKKVVSHWAKYYRGLVLRQIAQNNITSFAQLVNLPFDGLKLIEIKQSKNIKTFIMDIV
jgi:cytoplasmic iron level regulating protein YaaA (DUF328/UPF0246 family)